jgi:uncharacterized Fe-S cluster protein YjdI
MAQPHSHSYTNGELTVIWKPDVCIHSGICVRGLIRVFNPGRRPWIDMSAAPTDTIEAQVHRCPSGALTCYRNADGPPVA